jgi:hypothetical protein
MRRRPPASPPPSDALLATVDILLLCWWCGLLWWLTRLLLLRAERTAGMSSLANPAGPTPHHPAHGAAGAARIPQRPAWPFSKPFRLPRVQRQSSATALGDYERMALYLFEQAGGSDTQRAPCVELRLPTAFLAPVLETLRATWPDVRSYVVQSYQGHGHVLLWRVPLSQ